MQKQIEYRHAFAAMCLMDAFMELETQTEKLRTIVMAGECHVASKDTPLAKKMQNARAEMGSMALRDCLLKIAPAFEHFADMVFPEGCGEYGVAFDFELAPWFLENMVDWDSFEAKPLTVAALTECAFALVSTELLPEFLTTTGNRGDLLKQAA